MGILWHSGTVDPSHEHFISEKIKHSIIRYTEKQKSYNTEKKSQIFALYLPYQEIHEIGLLYANYELLSAGCSTIFLGANIPLESLNHLLKTKTKVIFVTYFTVQPENDNLQKYLNDFQMNVSSKGTCELWILGRKAGLNLKNIKNFKFFKDLKQFLEEVDKSRKD